MLGKAAMYSRVSSACKILVHNLLPVSVHLNTESVCVTHRTQK